ncbi:MAG: hypothetical protein JWQ11_819, partial [Rhizobacter sp.]|nr:hypothetical protein [Rhizobacter sp.]
MKFALKPLAMLMSGMALVSLAACGGDDDDSTPVVATPTGSISGLVIDGILANATVCLDLNDNRACDAGEPTAITAADGKYTLNALVDADIAAHPVLAMVTAGTTTDGGIAVATSYLLASP